MRKFWGFLLMVWLCLGCNSMKYSIDHLPNQQIGFGKGGGFAGISHTYVLLENGQFFKWTSMSDSVLVLDRVKPKDAKALFSRINELGIDTIQFDHPGNIYYYLGYTNPDSIQYRVTWGDFNVKPPENVKELYQELNELIKENLESETK